MATTESECLEALRAAAAELGESPTKSQYEALGLTPASATIIRQIGGWNEAKRRAGLETYQSRGSRVSEQPDHVELPADLSWEELSVDQRWHYRNADWNSERTLRRRARLRSWVNDEKRERGCCNCSVDDPAVLDFHHRYPADKEMAVGRMVTYGFGKDALREEMGKCDVLCANCHRRAHYSIPDAPDRSWVRRLKLRSDGCTSCSEDSPACLEFHHARGEKHDTVAKMLADGRPREAIAREIAKCDLLCANCHREHHFEPPEEARRYDNHK